MAPEKAVLEDKDKEKEGGEERPEGDKKEEGLKRVQWRVG